MKCLSIRQPWAELICTGVKDIENRSRGIVYRGWVLVHAGLKFDREAGFKKPFSQYTRGAIIGRAELIDCVRDHPSKWARPGSWHWVLSNPVLFGKPIPYKGRLGLFEVPEEDLKQ